MADNWRFHEIGRNDGGTNQKFGPLQRIGSNGQGGMKQGLIFAIEGPENGRIFPGGHLLNCGTDLK